MKTISSNAELKTLFVESNDPIWAELDTQVIFDEIIELIDRMDHGVSSFVHSLFLCVQIAKYPDGKILVQIDRADQPDSCKVIFGVELTRSLPRVDSAEKLRELMEKQFPKRSYVPCYEDFSSVLLMLANTALLSGEHCSRWAWGAALSVHINDEKRAIGEVNILGYPSLKFEMITGL